MQQEDWPEILEILEKTAKKKGIPNMFYIKLQNQWVWDTHTQNYQSFEHMQNQKHTLWGSGTEGSDSRLAQVPALEQML